jgi:hypothetical protein
MAVLALSSAACSGSAPQAAPQKAQAPDPKTDALLRKFAAAIVARDYAAAYDAVATERRGSLSLAELQENFGHYRDGLPDVLKTEVEVEPYDRESASLVPDELRDRIVAEGVVRFEPGDDLEGFSAHVWILMEAGQPKLASFYVED